MGKRSRLILITLALLIAVSFTFILFRHREPAYQGRTLTQWLELYDYGSGSRPRSGDWETNIQLAVKAIGTNAIPILLEWVQADSSVTSRLNNMLDRQSLIPLRFRRAQGYQSMASAGFGMLGNDALPAVPVLLKMASPTNSYGNAAFDCLYEIKHSGALLLPVLSKQLSENDVEISYNAAGALCDLYKTEAEALGLFRKFPEFKIHGTPIIPLQTNAVP